MCNRPYVAALAAFASIFLASACSDSGSGGSVAPPALPPNQNVPIIDALPPSTSATQIGVTGTIPGRLDQGTMVRGMTALEEVLVSPTGQTFKFDLQLAPNKANSIFVTTVTSSGDESAVAMAEVRQDSVAPSVFIDAPGEGSLVTTPTVTVTGRVSDLLSGFMGLHVEVNGVAAVVHEGQGSNGTFAATGIPVDTSSVGAPTTLTAVATDAVGNQASVSVDVSFDAAPPGSPVLSVLSGQDQTGAVASVLPLPISVMVQRGDGSPWANKVVTFDVTRSDGRMSANSGGQGQQMLQVPTDSSGVASAYWRLGSDAGCGNNRVTITSTGVWGMPTVCASGQAVTAKQLNIGSGNNQVAEPLTPAPEPLRVWVSDGCNGIPGVSVDFAVVQGEGTFGGVNAISVVTGPTGHASVSFKAGEVLGNNVVEATVAGISTNPARFTIRVTERDPATPTSFIATVLNNSSQPIENAVCELSDLRGTVLAEDVSDIDGRVAFTGVTYQGPAHLHVDGSTATAVGGRAIPAGTFPALEYEVVVTPDIENRLPACVLLPPLLHANERLYSTTTDTILEVAGIDGLRMTISAGSMMLDGQPAPDGTIVALNQVHHDDVPMPMPNGAAPPFAWTLQPAGATFDPPIQIEYPNMSGLPPGSISYFLSFDHDIGEFGIVATGSVSSDGMVIRTDPGSGLSVAGWGCNCPPYSVSADCCSCGQVGGGAQEVSRGKEIFMAQAFPLAYGPWVTVASPFGPLGISIDAEPLGDTLVLGQVRYFACRPPGPDCEVVGAVEKIEEFNGSISIVNGDSINTVQVRFKGLPLGSAVQVCVNTGGASCNPCSSSLTSPPGLEEGEGAGLDGTWLLSAGGQTVVPNPGGSFRLANVTAADLFGSSGPGSPPDQFSDDFVRVVGVRENASMPPLYVFSEPFQFSQGGSVVVNDLTFTTIPPPLLDFLQITIPPGALTSGSEQVQATVIATMGDGSMQDVTPKTSWTSYRTSNPAIAEVDENGLITARSTGGAFITATNGGVTAVALVTVVLGDTTTVVGSVEFADGSPAVGATVVTALAPGATTGSDGAFSISGVPAGQGALSVWSGTSLQGMSFAASVSGVEAVANGITDVGVIVLGHSVIPNVIASCDAGEDTLRTLDLSGALLESAALGFSGVGLAVDRYGLLWIAGEDRVVRIDHSGAPRVVSGFVLKGASLRNIAVAPDDTLWLCDQEHRIVLQVDFGGSFLQADVVSYEVPQGLAIAPTDDSVAGYMVWYTSFTNQSAQGEVVRLDPATGDAIRSPLTNVRLWGVAVDAQGRVWVPVEVGGTPSLDRLDGYMPDGSRFSMEATTGWTGTHMISAVVSPAGDIWCTAADGDLGGGRNPSVLFKFDSQGRFVSGLDMVAQSLNGAPRGIALDGDLTVWASLAGSDALYRLPIGAALGSQVAVGDGPTNFGDPTGYLQAFVIWPDADFDADGMPNRAELLVGRNPFRPD